MLKIFSTSLYETFLEYMQNERKVFAFGLGFTYIVGH